ncbi:hypothetical protein FISHEDRAFT_69964 [Fistulina hepatica ATCC 64428]|uniref:Uncharacterized protein n=1 Tax=Fistulina hepatica ATCC 64428 TaxID=1128425 RepID=A0A0D7AKK6_9AGAR|nr:hypothetical protein FISHEDRAFT_69964 [Fistulina hepatica ATCC 64428]
MPALRNSTKITIIESTPPAPVYELTWVGSDPRNGRPVDGRAYRGKWKVPPWEMPAGSTEGKRHKRRGGKTTKKGEGRVARQVRPKQHPRSPTPPLYPARASSSSSSSSPSPSPSSSSSSCSSSSPSRSPATPVAAVPHLIDSPALDAGATGAPVALPPLPMWASVLNPPEGDGFQYQPELLEPSSLYQELAALGLASYDVMPGWEEPVPTCVDVPNYEWSFADNVRGLDIPKDGTDAGFGWFP